MTMKEAKISDESLSSFHDMKIRQLYNYIIFKIDDNNDIVLEYKNKNDLTDNAFEKEFIKKITEFVHPRYAVIDLTYYTFNNNLKKIKLIFIEYIPDNAPVKEKMIYTGRSEVFLKQLNLVMKKIQASDLNDLKFDKIIETILSE